MNGAQRLLELDRLFYLYTAGDRVRAMVEIFYACSGAAVAEGTLGTVDVARPRGIRGLAVIQWDTGARETTSCESVEPIGGLPDA